MSSITLNPAEQAFCRYLAERRHASNRSAGVQNQRIGPQDDAFTDLNGMGGEWVFCKATRLYPDTKIAPQHGGYDVVTHKDYTADIKTTPYENGRLLAVAGKTLSDAQVYVLVIGRFPTYRIAGWAWAGELLVPQNLVDLGYGQTYALPQSALHKMEG
jgi:hypothetical protein